MVKLTVVPGRKIFRFYNGNKTVGLLLTLWFCPVNFQMYHYLEWALRVERTLYDGSFHHESCMLQQPLIYAGTICNQT